MQSLVSAGNGATASLPAATGPLLGAAAPTRSGFVALSRFVVANGMEVSVKAAFRKRPHLVDHTAGFVRMEVLCPLDRPQEIWLAASPKA